jgi:hypothetical protein
MQQSFSPLYGDWMSASQIAPLGRSGRSGRRFQSPLWGLDECFLRGRDPPRAGEPRRFSPLYGDWMSASRGGAPAGEGDQLRRFSPLYGDWMSASRNGANTLFAHQFLCFSPLYGDWMSASDDSADPWRARVVDGFQSPLWGLDECFTARPVVRLTSPVASSFSPLYGDWMSASAAVTAGGGLMVRGGAGSRRSRGVGGTDNRCVGGSIGRSPVGKPVSQPCAAPPWVAGVAKHVAAPGAAASIVFHRGAPTGRARCAWLTTFPVEAGGPLRRGARRRARGPAAVRDGARRGAPPQPPRRPAPAHRIAPPPPGQTAARPPVLPFPRTAAAPGVATRPPTARVRWVAKAPSAVGGARAEPL